MFNSLPIKFAQSMPIKIRHTYVTKVHRVWREVTR